MGYLMRTDEMSTTLRAQPRTASRARASARASGETDSREHQYDLLTATLIGIAIGAGTALLFRRGPQGYRPIGPALRAAGRGARWAGGKGLEGARWAGGQGARGARWAADEAEELWDKVPREAIKDRVEDYLESAYDAVNDTVESELSDLRKAIRKQRKRLGV
jgi:gas vesicle protein